MKLLGNLDCEAGWAGAALPEAVRRRISLYAPLFAACAPDDGERPEVWVPTPVDPARLLAAPGWTPPVVQIIAGSAADPATAASRGRFERERLAGTDASPAAADAPRTVRAAAAAASVAHAGFDLAWADPAAAHANDRARTLAIAEALGAALPGARVVTSLDELDAAAAWLAPRPWVCKARWTSAGRDRARGTGRPEGELRTRLARMLARFGPLVLEPWLDRLADFGVCGEIVDGAAVEVRLLPPHRLRTDPRGGFLGIELAPVDPAITEALHATARAAALHLAADTGYRGRFAIDAFVYRGAGGDARLHPLCEINARHSFGWIAHGLARRLGIRRLGFDAPPAGATRLIAAGDDGVTAWCD